MLCPYCGNDETKVTDKRDSKNETRRRRECLKCGKRFTTYERIEPVEIFVIKKDGGRDFETGQQAEYRADGIRRQDDVPWSEHIGVSDTHSGVTGSR